MSLPAFRWVRSLTGGRDLNKKPIQMGLSATVAKGDLLKWSSGRVIRLAGQTDLPNFVCDVPGGPSVAGAAVTTVTGSTDYTKIAIIPVFGQIFAAPITPLLNSAGGVVSGTTTQVVAPLTAGSSNDLAGGVVYLPEQDIERTIASNTYSGGNVTIVVTEPFGRAPVAGDSVKMVPFGRGASPKFDSSTPYNKISNAIADITGGKLVVWDVDLKNNALEVYFLTQ